MASDNGFLFGLFSLLENQHLGCTSIRELASGRAHVCRRAIRIEPLWSRKSARSLVALRNLILATAEVGNVTTSNRTDAYGVMEQTACLRDGMIGKNGLVDHEGSSASNEGLSEKQERGKRLSVLTNAASLSFLDPVLRQNKRRADRKEHARQSAHRP